MAEHIKMTTPEAKAQVQALRRIVLDTYDRTIKDQPFFVELRAGTLSRERLRGWATNWYAFALEVNTGMATVYHQFVGFFKRHPECEDLIAQKIGEEFTTPALGGHARMLTHLGKVLGVEPQTMIEAELIPEARGPECKSRSLPSAKLARHVGRLPDGRHHSQRELSAWRPSLL